MLNISPVEQAELVRLRRVANTKNALAVERVGPAPALAIKIFAALNDERGRDRRTHYNTSLV